MKSKFLVFLVIVFSYQSCCLRKGEEIDRITFTVQEKTKIPYTDSQLVDMITDDGFQFQLSTNTRSSFFSDQEHCEDYTSYESYNVDLSSELPNLDIALSLNRSYNYVDDVEFIDVGLTINRLFFYYDLETPLETIEINGTIYTDVYRYFSNQVDVAIAEVLFNEASGILRINYLNGDYVQID
ncbi:hypothetical protein [Winogradskyella flava]|uniref:Uncharacterized protein n=1 Tax=Winogradskyella flava TaxID=1884876 RepID=A0A842IRI0_9FLAO|nr:hypothetical protein [Winogradskyella flava]MBC2845335.1 hypothetical protein [Winogradskyella flava]